MQRLWIAVAAAALVAACSGVRLVYNQLDWLVPLYLRDFVALDAAQTRLLDKHLAEVLRWHCGTQLPGYAAELRTINADFQSGRMSASRLAAHHDRLLDYWRAIMEQAAPRLGTLLATASDQQVEELFANLAEKNREFQEKFVERKPPARRKDADKAMTARIEDWVGDLTPTQRRAVTAWSEEIPLNGTERLEVRRQWQAVLKLALERRSEPERFARAVHALFVHTERYWTPGYREKYDRIRARTLALLAEIGASLTPAQRAHLANRAGNWAEDFDRLACVAAPGGEDAAPAEASEASFN